jgi:PPK2 family polyphosphate:nucleotide phosphotransferase
MTDDFKKCQIKPGTKVDLSKFPTGETFGWSKEDAKKQTEKNLARIAELQEVLYAEGKHSLLIVLQGMDTGGKDGVVKSIGGAMNPQGVTVTSFKRPTQEEIDNGFMWRIEKAAPKKAGQVAIFNRSQYEDVGVVRVHGIVDEKEIPGRYKTINDFEKKLADPKSNPDIPGGVTVIKFWLHISPDEQWERFRERLERPEKNWKFEMGDLKERAHFPRYMEVYSDAINNCNSEDAPWIVVPADKKWARDLIISQVVVDKLEALKMEYPKADPNIAAIRKHFFSGQDPIAPEDMKAKLDTFKPVDTKPAGKPSKARAEFKK